MTPNLLTEKMKQVRAAALDFLDAHRSSRFHGGKVSNVLAARAKLEALVWVADNMLNNALDQAARDREDR